MLFPGPLGRQDPDDERQAVVRACGRCAEIASGRDVTLTMENVGAGPGVTVHGRAGHMREIVCGVAADNFRLTLDTGNFVWAEDEPLRAAETLSPYVAHVHAKDLDHGAPPGHEQTPGRGIVDFPTVFRALESHGFDGYISTECAGPHDRQSKEAMVAQGARYIRETWRAVSA
jgi:sugar phosphate isomerase/epimerase